MKNISPEIEADLKRAVRLEYWTLFWQSTIVAAMFFAMGSSQAMKSAWVEDFLGLVPAIVFLVAVRFEQRDSTRRFPYGFDRAQSLAFLIAATALVMMSLFLVYDSVMKLLAAEHPTIGPVNPFGEHVWMGWIMIGVLIYSVVPPFVLGRMKLPLARRLSDKVLHTDALMQKADWMTGLAGTAGVLGVGFGLWWADAAAAGFIAVEIFRDGKKALSIAAAELIDGAPRELDSNEIAKDAKALGAALERRFGGTARLRESGRYILAQLVGARPGEDVDLGELWPGDPERGWRLRVLSFGTRRHDE